MYKIIETLAIIILAVLIFSILTMPWPINVLIGSLALLAFILTYASGKRAKKES